MAISVDALRKRLREGLKNYLPQVGIKPKVRLESVPGTALTNVIVVAPQFTTMPYDTRQRLVWDVANRVLTEDELFTISMIATLSPGEF